jgi:hypothetical protein
MDKKKISNSADLNNYYKKVGDKLKKFSEFNIPINKIASYLKPGTENFNRFIEEDNELKDIDGIHDVLRDVILDMYHAFKDGLYNRKKVDVKTFENLLVESIFDISEVDKKDKYEHEKALADIYGVSLSYIDLRMASIHLYTVNILGEIKKVIVFNKTEIEGIKTNIVNKLSEDIKKRTTELLFDKTITIGELLGQSEIESIVSAKVSIEDVLEYIAKNTGLEVEVKFVNNTIINNVDYYLFEVSATPIAKSAF